MYDCLGNGTTRRRGEFTGLNYLNPNLHYITYNLIFKVDQTINAITLKLSLNLPMNLLKQGFFNIKLYVLNIMY